MFGLVKGHWVMGAMRWFPHRCPGSDCAILAYIRHGVLVHGKDFHE